MKTAPHTATRTRFRSLLTMLCTVGTLTALATATVQAGTTIQVSRPAIQTATTTNTSNAYSSSQTFGWTFTVGTGFNLSVTNLGVWADSFLHDAHDVGIWNTSGTLLGSAIVNQSTNGSLISSYVYAPAFSSPISLSAGGTYTIGAFYMTGDTVDSLIYRTAQTFDSKITFGKAVLSISDGLARPSADSHDTPGYFGPNFLFTSSAAALAATYWKGQTNSNWSGTNWASDSTGTTTTATPTSTADITFSATGAQNQTPTVMDADTTIQSLTIKDNVGITGTKTLTISSTTNVGDGGALTITSGVTVKSLGGSLVQGSGDGATVTVIHANAKWDTTNVLTVGDTFGNTGTVNVLFGGAVTSGSLILGSGIGATGTATIYGAGSTLTTGLTEIGRSGTGTLNIQNGGVLTSVNGIVAVQLGSVGTVTVDGSGSKWTMTGDLKVDTGGDGTLTITNGGVVSDVNGIISTGSASTLKGTVTVDGAGSKWTNSGNITVGDTGPGTLDTKNGGVVTSVNGIVAAQLGSVGTVTVDGSGSMWTMTGDLTLGSSGTGTVTITKGGVVSDVNGFISTGSTVTVDGSGSQWINSGNVTVGDYGTGTLNIKNGGVVTSVKGILTAQYRSVGTVTVDGAGSKWTMTGDLELGSPLGGGGTGTVTITKGGVVSDVNGFISNDSTVTVDGSGSQWNNSGNVTVGSVGPGTLAIKNGGEVKDVNGFISGSRFTSGTVTVDGADSKWTNSGDVTVDGTLAIKNGGVVTSVDGIVAARTVGTVTVDGAGSKWTMTGDLTVGSGSAGTVTITKGGEVKDVNGSISGTRFTSGTVTVDGADSKWTNSGDVTVGRLRAGTLNLQNGGTVSAGNGLGEIYLGSLGVLNIGAFRGATTAGTVNAAEVSGGDAGGVLNFNQTNNITFAPLITNDIAVNQRGTGVTTLNKANTYKNGTTINGGVLQTGNASALGTGPVALNAGSLRAVGTLNVGSLKWNNGFIALEPTQGDVINVKGAFNNGGGGGVFAIGPQDLVVNKHYTLVTFGSTDFTLDQFSALSPNPTIQYKSTFFLNPRGDGGKVEIAIIGATGTGDRLHNTENGVPTFVDYTTNGNVISGLTPSGIQELNTYINSLFVPNSTLTVPGPNTLFVAGDTNVNNSFVVVNGALQIGGNFTDPNSTTIVNNVLTVGGTTTIAGDSVLYVASSGVFTTGADLNVNDSALTVDGVAFVGGSTNLYSGSTALVNGLLQSPVVNVFHGAYLGGSGSIVGNVSNSGTVSPGNGIGTLHITGNYRQSNSGSLVIQLASPNAHDQLVITGGARLGGTLRVQDVGGIPAPKRGGPSYRVLSARGGVSGTFSNVITPYAQGPGSLVYLGAQYTANAVLIAPMQNTFANALSFVKLTPNQTATAAALDSALSDVRQDKVLTYLDAQNITQVPHQLARQDRA